MARQFKTFVAGCLQRQDVEVEVRRALHGLVQKVPSISEEVLLNAFQMRSADDREQNKAMAEVALHRMFLIPKIKRPRDAAPEEPPPLRRRVLRGGVPRPPGP
jgi:hypothetical protein